MFGILASEILGFNVVLHEAVLSSAQAVWGLGGCDPVASGIEGSCDPPLTNDRHVVLETWDDGTAPATKDQRFILGTRMPLNLGSIGYEGFESMFIPTTSRVAALNAEGLALEFYKSYNKSWHRSGQYFTRYTDVPTEGLKACSTTKFWRSDLNKDYLNHTGDADGLETVDGKLVAKCIGGASGVWWLAPACRQDPQECVPVIDSGDGWFLEVIMHRAAAYNMPFAVAVGTWEKYASSPALFDLGFYWWSPDNTFIDLRPEAIRFPDHNPDEWNAGNPITESNKVGLSKWVHHALPVADPQLTALARNLVLSRTSVDEMLLETKRNKTYHQIACEWLRTSMEKWSPWIPYATRCDEGMGLVDEAGEFVEQRSSAVACGLCRPGAYSMAMQDVMGPTRVCLPCGAGLYQARPAQATCLPCESGTFASSLGQSSCDLCPRGRASDAVGASSCGLCDPGSYQLLEGATSCVACARGNFQADGGATACESCPLGTFSSANASNCENCRPGHVAETPGSSSCTACRPGHFAERGGLSGCSRCDVGSYAAGDGLTACELCADGAPLFTTMRRLKVSSGGAMWHTTDAAETADACGCQAGARPGSAGECIPCVEKGVVCDGMDVVRLLPGYYSAADLSIFACRDELRCPGGVPGKTCARGRVGVACTICDDGLTPSDDGGCEPCLPTDALPSILSGIALLVACCLLYLAVARGGHSRSSYTMLLVGISSGLMIGLMQQLSVMGLVNVAYVEPMETFLKLVKVVAFDLDEILRLGCVGLGGAISRYASKLAMVFAAAATISVTHVVSVIFRHHGRFKENRSTLVGALGTLGLIFYTSVVVLMLEPFNCTLHPNGKWTVSKYENVLCWGDDGDHDTMIALGVLSFSMPLSIFVVVVMLVRQYPNAVRRSDTAFLRSFGFLFFRFRPQVHWYILMLMTRSLFIGIVPVVPRASAQIYLLQVALIMSFAMVIHYKPWRVRSLNWLDVFFGVIMLVFLNIASFMAIIGPEDARIMGWLCMAMAIFVGILVPMLVAIPIFKRAGMSARRYQFFLCHHKSEAGAFARWLKIGLESSPLISRDVFLDSDNLESLDQLLNYVATDVESLLVLSTKFVYRRPWCIAEMATARANGVPTVVLALPGREEPVDNGHNVAHLAVEGLVQNGIGEESVKDTLQAFSRKQAIRLPQRMGDVEMTGLVDILARGDTVGDVAQAPPAEPDGIVAIIARVGNFEANAAARVLRALLVPHLCHMVNEIPWILDEAQELPDSVEKVLIVFTVGCLSDGNFVQKLIAVHSRSIQRVVPVIADGEFRVPDRDAVASLLSDEVDVEQAANSVREVFKDIAVTVNTKQCSAPVLQAAVGALGHRLSFSMMGQTRSGKWIYAWNKPSVKATSSAESVVQGTGSSVARDICTDDLSEDIPAEAQVVAPTISVASRIGEEPSVYSNSDSESV